jgi:Cu-processing system ATP-binding protein
MIEIRDIHKSYGELEVLKGISCKFNRGNVIAVIGPNGSGKTTLLKSILGLVIPEKGSILFEGKDIKNEYLYRRSLGYMPQIPEYPENLKTGEFFEMIKDIRGCTGNSGLDLELFETFKIEGMLSRTISSLSGGMKQRISGALAFMFRQDVIIMDEPTSGLDPVSNEQIKKKIIKERNDGKLIIITTHILSEINELADRVIFLLEGSLKFDEEVSALNMVNGIKLNGKFLQTLEKYYD